MSTEPFVIRILPFATQINQKTIPPLHNLTFEAEVTFCVQGVVSPVLANVYLHYVLDLWFHKKWRPSVPQGEAIIVRYADDIVVGFQHKRDAEQYLRDLRERLTRFGLSLHPDKTRLVEFGRFAAMKRRQRGAGKPETFDFLGFTHHYTTTRRGRFRLGRNRSPNGSTGPWRASKRCSASAGITTSGRWANGSGGSAKAG